MPVPEAFGGWLLAGRTRLTLGPQAHDGDGSTVSFSLPVPNALALLGTQWAAQAVVGGTPYTLTDAVTAFVR